MQREFPYALNLPKANLWLFPSVEISFVNTSALQSKGEGEANQQICERILRSMSEIEGNF